jgi:hypothetical protein
MKKTPVQNLLQGRRSACADAALRAEIQRVEKMTMEQRMRAALTLGKGFSGMQTSHKPKNIHGGA